MCLIIKFQLICDNIIVLILNFIMEEYRLIIRDYWEWDAKFSLHKLELARKVHFLGTPLMTRDSRDRLVQDEVINSAAGARSDAYLPRSKA